VTLSAAVPAGAPLPRRVLREQVKEVLLERIIAGRYGPGERLVETRIAQELGTSQAPVREALRELEQLRFVESAPYRGARVRAISPEELAEIYPVRAALEEVAAREAAVRLRGEVAPLERELEGMLAAADAADLHALVDHDVRFHRLIVEAAANRTLLEVWLSLRVEERTAITTLATGISHRDVAESHRPVLDALRERDRARAGAALRRHIEELGELVLEGGTR
jgi:DNA-binding GntR family transcriptional regulator